MSPSNFGRLFLHPKPQESIVFFTQTDVNDGKLFFQAFDVDERIDDEIEFELRADDIQPARFKWRIDINPVDKRLNIIEPGTKQTTNDDSDVVDKATPNIAPELNQHFPVFVLIAIIVATVIILCCRRNSSKKKKGKQIATRDEHGFNLNLDPSNERELPNIPETHGAELLDTTVYASVGNKRRKSSGLKDIQEEPEPSATLKRPSYKHLESFEQQPGPPQCKITPLRQPLGSAGSAFKPTPLAALSSRSGPITGLPVTPVLSTALKQPRGSLDAQTKPTKLKQNQYWV